MDNKNKKAEDELMDNEERFRSIYENSTIGIYRTTPDGRVLMANPELVRMLRYDSFEELAKRGLEKEGYEEYKRSEFKSLLEKNGEIKGLESKWYRKDGSFLFVRESARVVRDEKGRVVYYDGVVEDITDRKIAEAKEKKQKKSLEILSDVAMMFVELSFDRNIYEFIAEQLQSFIMGKSYVVVNSIDSLQGILTNRAIAGLGQGYKKVAQLLGRDLKKLYFKADEKELSYLNDGRLHESGRTLYDIFFKTVPLKVCSVLEKLFNVGKIYTIGLVKEGKLFGTVLIFMQKDQKLNVDKSIIETFVKQSAIAVQRRNAEERIRHLNLILGSIRNVNQLITSEKDKKELLSKACSILTETRGYSSVWIALLDKNNKIEYAAESNIGKKFKEVLKKLNSGSMIECCRRAMRTDGLVFIKNTHKECKGCPLLGTNPTEKAFTIRLGYEDKVYGLFSVSLPENLSIDVEEQQLFEELAGDLSFALYRIELEEENRKAVEKLRLSEDRLSKIMKVANDGTWDWNLITNEVYFDPRYYEMAGYKPGDFPHHLQEFQKKVHPADLDYVMEQAEKYLSGEIDRYSVEFRFKTKSGTWIWILGRGIIVKRDENGQPLQFIGTHSDITERKRIEQELKLSEEKFRKRIEQELKLSEEKFRILFEFAPDAYYIHDMKGNLIDGNKAAENLIGYTKEELIGKNIFNLNLLPKSQIPKVAAMLAENVSGKRVINREITLKRKDGIKVNVEISGFSITLQGKKFVFGNAHDITDRKKAEVILKQSETRYRTIFESSSDALFTMKGEIFSDCNESTLKMFRCKREDIVGNTPYRFSPKYQTDGRKSKDAALEYINAALDGKPQFFEWNHCQLDGTVFPAEVSLNRFEIDGETYLLARVKDITDRKKSEEELKKWANIFEFAGWGIVIGGIDEAKSIELMNPAFAAMHGYTVKELEGKPITAVFPQDEMDKVIKNINIAQEKGHHIFEADHIRRDGTRFPSLIDVTAVKDEKGKVLYRIVNVNDITEKKKVENALKNSLKEKDVLIREIHHRVKNNLQIIHSLISLQQRGLKDEEAIENFNETKARVLVMARVHEMLYGSDNLSEINFKKYLESMAVELLSGSDIRNKVNLKYDIMDIYLHIETAIPCGLIVNELITNSLKYAFKDMSKGIIYLSFKKDKNNMAKLIVKDNGSGLTKDIDFENPDSFGLKLVNILTEQLDGELRISSENGTKFIITFPLDK